MAAPGRGGRAPDRRLYETAVLATLRDRLRSGDVWVERSSGYRRFDSYLLPASAVPAAAAELGLPATADEWLAARGAELDRRLRRFARRLKRGELEGVELRDGPTARHPSAGLRAAEALALAGPDRGVDAGSADHRGAARRRAGDRLRRGFHQPADRRALRGRERAARRRAGRRHQPRPRRMAAASHGVTRDRLIWTADAYIRPETYRAALARIIDAHHALPVAAAWGDGTTSSSDRQFFRSARRGDAAGEVNARYGPDPGLGFYTHVSDQHGPYSARVMSATSHEAPYVLDGLLHHGTALRIDTHFIDTGGASDHVFILCAMLGFRFCPRLRDFADRRLACMEPRVRLRRPRPAARAADQGGRHPRALGRGAAPGRLAARRHRDALGHAEEARGLPPAEPARPCPAGAGPHRAHAVHARLAGIARAPAPLPRRPEQERAAPRAGAGRVHLQAGPRRRPRPRMPSSSAPPA